MAALIALLLILILAFLIVVLAKQWELGEREKNATEEIHRLKRECEAKQMLIEKHIKGQTQQGDSNDAE
jgi:hypothetical protein